MAPIFYRIRSWLRVRWGATLALALVVAIAGGIALTLVAGAARTITAPDRYSSWRGHVYDVSLQQANGRPRTAELEALPATARVEAATFVFGQLESASGTPADVLVFAGTEGPLGTRLVDGTEPDPAHPGGFVATRSFVASARAHVGDRFDLATYTQPQADDAGFDAGTPAGPVVHGTLVGVIDGPGDLDDNYQVALFPKSLLDAGDVGVAATTGVAALKPGSTVEDLRKQLDGLPEGNAFSLSKATWISSAVRAAVNAQAQGLVILGAIAFVAVIVVLGQLLSRQLRLTDTERTVLASVGFSQTQIAAEPVCRGAIAVVAGAIGAGAIAYLSSGLFPVDFVRRVEPHPGRRFDPLIHALGPVLFAVVLLAWVGYALIADARASTRQRSASIAEKLAAVIPNGQISTALRFAFAQRARRARSAAAPLVGLILVFCVLFGALTFGANLARTIDKPAQYGVNFDLAIGSGGTAISPTLQDQLVGSDDVGALTLYGTTTAAIGAASLDIVGMQPVKGRLAPESISGRLPRTADEIALGSVAARHLRVRTGDEVEINGATGPRKLQVTGLTLVPAVNGADKLADSGLVTFAGLQAIDPDGAMNAAAIKLAPHASAGAAHRIATLTGVSAGLLDRPPAILNLQRVRKIPFLVASTVGGLAILSLGHLMIVAVRRRRRDLAILRALGATPRWISGVVHWQATITTAAVLAVGIPVGSVLGRLVYRGFIEHVGTRTDVIVPFAWLGIALLALLVLANLVAAVPARRSSLDSPAPTLTEG